MIDYNNTPIPDLDGFTPWQMHQIIYNPFNDDCPIKLNQLNRDQPMRESLILKIIIYFLAKMSERNIKLTQKGNLPFQIIKDIYTKNYFPDDWIESGIQKIRTETDWLILHNIKIVLVMAGLIRKKHNQLSQTRKCASLMMVENYSEIFYEFLKAFTSKFNWAYNDAFTDGGVGQIGFLYSLYFVNKYGSEERNFKYFSDLYFRAFPSFLENSEGKQFIESAFRIRFFTRFAIWFGFIEENIAKEKQYIERKINLRRTNLLKRLIHS
ncbi:MAG: hypothetical protein KJ799_09075 [Bacteroidetes bacterium]|nr:hypothetical protein [Bacteroidota bacterium]